MAAKSAQKTGGKTVEVGEVEKYKDDTTKKLTNEYYGSELQRLQLELVKMAEWIRVSGHKLVLIFEGRDAAGKGGTIKRITEPLNPRVARTVALPKPTERERTQWYFQRYVAHLPAAGEIVIYDRSWYNRAGVERVMGFCTDEEYWDFIRSVPDFERMLIRSGIQLVKYWFSVSDREQERRFKKRIGDPARRWKFSDVDVFARSKWLEYARAKDIMIEHTSLPEAPWWEVDSDDKKRARLNCISHLLSLVDYEQVDYPLVDLPKTNWDPQYQRPPMETLHWIPEIY
jgi:polyphosphate kinase 2